MEAVLIEVSTEIECTTLDCHSLSDCTLYRGTVQNSSSIEMGRQVKP